MAERNAWVIERTDLGVVKQIDSGILSPTRGAIYEVMVVRYDFIPTQFPEFKPFSVRCEHDPSTTQEHVDLDECIALGKAIRGMLGAP